MLARPTCPNLGGWCFSGEKTPEATWAGNSGSYIPSIAGSACLPGLGLIGYPRLVPARLALPAPATTTATRSAAPAAEGGRCRCCMVQAKRARPEQGDESQASQGQPSKPSQDWKGLGLDWICQIGMIGPLIPCSKCPGGAKYDAPRAT